MTLYARHEPRLSLIPADVDVLLATPAELERRGPRQPELQVEDVALRRGSVPALGDLLPDPLGAGATFLPPLTVLLVVAPEFASHSPPA
jgi:hypothetical protein